VTFVAFGSGGCEWADDWLAAKADLAPMTRERYEGIIAKHIRPRWVKVRLPGVTHRRTATSSARCRCRASWSRISLAMSRASQLTILSLLASAVLPLRLGTFQAGRALIGGAKASGPRLPSAGVYAHSRKPGHCQRCRRQDHSANAGHKSATMTLDQYGHLSAIGSTLWLMRWTLPGPQRSLMCTRQKLKAVEGTMSWCRVCGRYHLFGACPRPELQDPLYPGSSEKTIAAKAVASSWPARRSASTANRQSGSRHAASHDR
jgi:hypothetical protein